MFGRRSPSLYRTRTPPAMFIRAHVRYHALFLLFSQFLVSLSRRCLLHPRRVYRMIISNLNPKTTRD